MNLLILDDWMRDPITLQNAQDLLEILDDRFAHTSTLIFIDLDLHCAI